MVKYSGMLPVTSCDSRKTLNRELLNSAFSMNILSLCSSFMHQRMHFTVIKEDGRIMNFMMISVASLFCLCMI